MQKSLLRLENWSKLWLFLSLGRFWHRSQKFRVTKRLEKTYMELFGIFGWQLNFLEIRHDFEKYNVTITNRQWKLYTPLPVFLTKSFANYMNSPVEFNPTTSGVSIKHSTCTEPIAFKSDFSDSDVVGKSHVSKVSHLLPGEMISIAPHPVRPQGVWNQKLLFSITPGAYWVWFQSPPLVMVNRIAVLAMVTDCKDWQKLQSLSSLLQLVTKLTGAVLCVPM